MGCYFGIELSLRSRRLISGFLSAGFSSAEFSVVSGISQSLILEFRVVGFRGSRIWGSA